MLKKIFIILLLSVISLSIYVVFVNLYLDWQYKQDVSSLEKNYSITDNFSIVNPNSISIPSSLRKYIQYSTPNYRDLSPYVNLSYSGKYRRDKYGEMYDFEKKALYSIKDGQFVSEWFINENRVIFDKLREKLSADENIYQYKFLGIRNQQEAYSSSAELFLRSKMIIDAVYFPYYYLASSRIDYKYFSNNRTLLELNTDAGKMNYVLDFNEDGQLITISSEEFNFNGDRLKLTAHYDNYISRNNYQVPARIRVEIENNFDKYLLYEANLDSINYR